MHNNIYSDSSFVNGWSTIVCYLNCALLLFYNNDNVERDRFEKLVASAVAGLPDEFRDMLDNVDVVVEDAPTRQQARRTGGRGLLLGLYEGVPMTGRTAGYNMVVPDKISIFQRAIESVCHSDAEIENEVREVVIHEVGHHFGLSDRRLEELAAHKHSERRRRS